MVQSERGAESQESHDLYAVAVSDVHLGYWKTDEGAFNAFVKRIRDERWTIEHFIVMGDFLDLYRRDDMALLKEKLPKKDGGLRMLLDLNSDTDESGSKKKKTIMNLRYVVGNHDFTIEDLENSYCVLTQFKFTPPKSRDLQWLGLPLEPQPSWGDQKYSFLHGHQLYEGRVLGQWYDAMSRYLCGQGEIRGRLSSALYEYWSLLPVFALSLGALIYLGPVWALVTLLALGIGLGLYRWQKSKLPLKPSRLKALVRSEEYDNEDDQILLLINSLPYGLRRKYQKHCHMDPKDRHLPELDETTFRPSEREEWEVRETYARLKRKGLLLNIDCDELEDMLRGTVTASKLPKPQGLHVIGHTHEAITTPSHLNLKGWEKSGQYKHINLGCWVKGKKHYYLTIDRSGKCRVYEWIKNRFRPGYSVLVHPEPLQTS